jgi:hypothetical protein
VAVADFFTPANGVLEPVPGLAKTTPVNEAQAARVPQKKILLPAESRRAQVPSLGENTVRGFEFPSLGVKHREVPVDRGKGRALVEAKA